MRKPWTIGEMRFAGHLPPLAERLQQPRHLSEVASVAKAVAVVLKTAAQSFFIDRRSVLLAGDGESEKGLAGEVILIRLERWIAGGFMSGDATVRKLDGLASHTCSFACG